MHHWSEGEWLESRAEIEILADGAAALHGPSQVIFSPNLNTQVAIDFTTSDCQRFRSHVLGIAYVDTANGNSVMVAIVKDSVGELHPPNQVVYPDAMSDVTCSVRYTYTPASFEQDLIISPESLPAPEAFGLSSETVRLEVWTEFLDPPEPAATAAGGPDPQDLDLDFGVVRIASGRIFLWQEGTEGDSVPVRKTWERRGEDGRHFLIESVPYPAVLKLTGGLQPPGGPGRNRAPRVYDSPLKKNGMLVRHFPPPPPSAKRAKAPLRMARTTLPGRALVMDYQMLSSGVQNYVFASDTTYYISGNVTCSGTNTVIEGGTVIKYTSGVSITIQSTNLDFQGSSFHPVVCTARDDATVGESLPGATNNPATNYYANPALRLITAASTLQNLRIRYAALGLEYQGSNHLVKHAQLVNVQTGLQPYATSSAQVSLRNVLAAGISNLFVGSNLTVSAEHLTLANASNLTVAGASLTNAYLTNCLLVAVTNSTGYTGANNQTVADITGAFQTVGAGQYYLATNSPYLGAGTTNMNPQLLADLAQRTVYPPLLLSNVILNINTILTPLVTRDAGAPSLGYHYDPLDYLMTGVTIGNATVILTNGASVAVDFSASVQPILLLSGTSRFTSQGTALGCNHIVRTHSVQEQPSAASSGWYPTFSGGSLCLRFTDLAQLAGGYYYLYGGATLELTHSQVRGGNFYVPPYTAGQFTCTNTLFERTSLSFATADSGLSLVFRNNLFKGGTLSVGAPTWLTSSIQNNLLDNMTIQVSSNSLTSSYNGYVNTPVLPSSSGGDVTTNALVYQVGPLGRFYQPTNSPFLNAGSTNADCLGLYYFTTTTNQFKETNSVVDIGLHYVALDANGQPIDTDGDGIPDYLRDVNGNGVVNSGETDPNSATDLGLKVQITKPRNNSPLF